MKLFKIFVQVWFNNSKAVIDTHYENIVLELPHKLPNDLKFAILGNKEILEKSKNCLETESSTQPPFQKSNFDNSDQKLQKSIFQTFLFLSDFASFLFFCFFRVHQEQYFFLKSRGCYARNNLQVLFSISREQELYLILMLRTSCGEGIVVATKDAFILFYFELL